ncbi:GH3 auxin-responsive promoter family protein [Antarcticibacterium sp. 1MA-6-2]|uniref:GH3 family domain-containing protein n=1 Tax=Antarcticibacterium sp. 1MA-6-2 TaxID=2908210 RepID=UPI0038FC75FB
MQLLNNLGNLFIKQRIGQIDHFRSNPEDVQEKCLINLVQTARNTEYGRKFNFA